VGFGYSCMDSPSFHTYERKVFIEALNDWGWTGEPAAKPEWYSEGSNPEGAI
jgi:hypothetical protein